MFHDSVVCFGYGVLSSCVVLLSKRYVESSECEQGQGVMLHQSDLGSVTVLCCCISTSGVEGTGVLFSCRPCVRLCR